MSPLVRTCCVGGGCMSPLVRACCVGEGTCHHWLGPVVWGEGTCHHWLGPVVWGWSLYLSLGPTHMDRREYLVYGIYIGNILRSLSNYNMFYHRNCHRANLLAVDSLERTFFVSSHRI